MLILAISAPVSGIIDNIPYVATITPIVGELTAVGASANVVMLGIARRSGSPISFWEFTGKGVLVTAMSISLAALYLWVRYFVVA